MDPVPAPLTPAQIKQLVDEGTRLNADIEALETKLTDVTVKLLMLPKGKYPGTKEDALCRVIDQAAGKIGYKLSEGPASEALARKLSGLAFGQLFDRKVVFSPCKGFAELAPKLLTPAKARKLLDFCAVAGKAARTYLTWAK